MSELRGGNYLRINPLIGESADSNVRRLLSILGKYHLYALHHSRRVSHSAMLLAEELGLSHEGIVNVGLAGLLHDIGKIATPSNLLNKPPTSDENGLTDDEYKILQRHVIYSRSILFQFSFPYRVRESVAYHHERLDGSGYPHGYSCMQIPFPARILAVADVFDAITHDRQYRHGRPLEEALQRIRHDSPRLFDKDVVFALERILERTLQYDRQRQYIQRNLVKLIRLLPPEQIVAVILYGGAHKFYFDLENKSRYPQDIDVAVITEKPIEEELLHQLIDGNGWRVDTETIEPALDGSIRLLYDPGSQRSIDVWIEPLDKLSDALRGKGNHNHRKISMPGYDSNNFLTPYAIAQRISEGIAILRLKSLKSRLGIEIPVNHDWHRSMMELILS